MTVELVAQHDVYHGEGPVWSSSWNELRWVDMLAGDVMSLDWGSGVVSRTSVGSVAAVVRPRREGPGAVVALEHGFALTDGPLDQLRELPTILSDPGVRFNEGGCDPDGSFYCGSMGYDAAPGRGTLYRMDTDGSVSVVIDSVTISNGFGFSPDGSIAYYVDTPTRRIDVMDYSSDRGLHSRRAWVSVPPQYGRPDGLTVDADGFVWVAFMGGSAVRRYSPAGEVDRVVELPVTQVTACAFGGPDLDQLFITTSRESLAPDDEPLAGALFRAEVGVAGLEPLPFAG